MSTICLALKCRATGKIPFVLSYSAGCPRSVRQETVASTLTAGLTALASATAQTGTPLYVYRALIYTPRPVILIAPWYTHNAYDVALNTGVKVEQDTRNDVVFKLTTVDGCILK